MSDSLEFRYVVDGEDFTRAGEASTDVKKKLKTMGLPPDIVRRVAIAIYEGEITVTVSDSDIRMVLADRGPGIPDVEKALQAGWSTAPENVRNLGFGAGMGLPNMMKYTDDLKIESEPGVGTTVTMTVCL